MKELDEEEVNKSNILEEDQKKFSRQEELIEDENKKNSPLIKMSPTNKQKYHCQTSTPFQISWDFLRPLNCQDCFFLSSFNLYRCEIKNFFK